MLISNQHIDERLSAALRAEDGCWLQEWSGAEFQVAVTERIALHGIALILCEKMELLRDWPEEVLEQIRDDARVQSLWEESHKRVMRNAMDAFHAADIASTFLKGTALAYWLYDDPAKRRRGDSDLLVCEDQLRKAREVLTAQGFVKAPVPPGLLFQEAWRFDTGMGFVHVLDLHWQVCDAPVLQKAMVAQEFFDRSVPLTRLSDKARASDPVLTFLHGAINQAWHGRAGYMIDGKRPSAENRLIWAMDNHLLAGGFSADQWQDLTQIAVSRGLAFVCLNAINLAQKNLATSVPEDVLKALEDAPKDTEITRHLLQSDQREAFWKNLSAASGPTGKLHFFWRSVFPTAEQMARKYPEWGTAPLVFNYARRLAVLARKSIR